jgi:7 transmembrane sweet-taste receptor of 3 GCPR
VETTDVLLPFALLLSLNVILLSVWTAIDPLVWQRIPTGEFTSYGTCKPEDGTAAAVLGSLLGIVNVGALLLAEIEAYKARNVSDHLSESKYIGLATISMFQMFVIGIPVIFLVRDQPAAQYFVYSGIIFVICTAVLLLIFVPKIHFDQHPPPKATLGGSGDGLNVKLALNNDHDDSNGDDDEAVLELKRLRNAVEDYKFKFLALKQEVQDKQLMEVEPFLASLEEKRKKSETAEKALSRASRDGRKTSTSSKFGVWGEGGFSMFSSYVPPEEEDCADEQEAAQIGGVTTIHETVSGNSTASEAKDRSKSDNKGIWGKSDFEVFSEVEEETEEV